MNLVANCEYNANITKTNQIYELPRLKIYFLIRFQAQSAQARLQDKGFDRSRTEEAKGVEDVVMNLF